MYKPYSNYHKVLKLELEKIAKINKSIFIGQQVHSEDFYNLLKDISLNKRYEMPVAEDLQLGVSVGLALKGYLPISIYQRMDFLPRAADQLINHLNLIETHSRNIYNPKVIIFTTIGLPNTGLQHSKDLIQGLKFLLHNIPVYYLANVKDIKKYFNLAIKSNNSSLLVANQSLFYGD